VVTSTKLLLRRARLVPRWTACGYTVLRCSHPPRPTQPSNLSETGNKYEPRGSGRALHLGR